MDKGSVIELLRNHSDDRGIRNFAKYGDPRLQAFGLGISKVKALAKGIKKDQALALELWNSRIYDAMLMATVLGEPKKMTRELVEQHADDMTMWILSHAYASNWLEKSPLSAPLAEEWRHHADHIRRRLAFLLVYGLVRSDKKLPDSFFLPFVEQLESIHEEENFVKDAMNGAMLAMGGRSPELYDRILPMAERLGIPSIDYGDTSCEPVDVVKHLRGPHIRAKVGR